MLKKIICCYCPIFWLVSIAFCQSHSIDSNRIISIGIDTIAASHNEMEYDVGNGKMFIYSKPTSFSFITKLPKDAAGIAAAPFRKGSVKPLVIVAASTALLLFADQSITDGVRKFSANAHFHPDEEYKDLISVKLGKKKVSIFKSPQNMNTGVYQFGQGFPSLLIGAGLFAYGRIHKDYRSISTASQLAETFILMGIGTQVLKRVTGRQSPSEATIAGGKWHLFPSFKNFQNHTPNFDAFPSGHLATLMSTVTVLAENYPEKSWIKPVGYSLTGLVGLSMINNKVHWASDYPLAIALGYLCAKQVVKNNRKVVQSTSLKKYNAKLSYSFNYLRGKLMPELIYDF